MSEQSIATSERPKSGCTGGLAGFVRAALGAGDRTMFRDFALLGSVLFAATFYVWTIDWRGAIPRDGTTLAAVGRDFRNLWMYGAPISEACRSAIDVRAVSRGFRLRLAISASPQWRCPPPAASMPPGGSCATCVLDSGFAACARDPALIEPAFVAKAARLARPSLG